ncbi:MAG: MFS transporter, partial [Alphaproteobacteria bacterium]|nr:MFS transporter [Alphaproteobacteria bacterium]
VLLLIQILHAFTFAASHLAITTYISNNIPENLTSSAQTFYDSLANGVLIGLCMTVSSYFYGAGFEGQVFWLMAGISIIALLGLGITRSQAHLIKD